MSSQSAAQLWPSGEVNNQFIYYFTGGFCLIYLMTLLVSYASRRTEPNVIVLPANADVADENKLFKYLVSIKTSYLPGCGCPTDAKIYIQLIGDEISSKFQRIKVYTAGRLLLQRGSHDMLLFRIEDYITEIKEVKLVIVGAKNLKWKSREIEVMDLTTGKRMGIPYRLVDTEKFDESQTDTVISPTAGKSGCCSTTWSKPCLYHPWISPVNLAIRFGAFTQLVNVHLIFFTLTLLILGTLIVHIVTSQDNTETFIVETDHLIYSFVVSIVICVASLLIEIFLRKIRSGNKMRLKKILGVANSKLSVVKPSQVFPNNFENGEIDQDIKESLYSVAPRGLDAEQDDSFSRTPYHSFVAINQNIIEESERTKNHVDHTNERGHSVKNEDTFYSFADRKHELESDEIYSKAAVSVRDAELTTPYQSFVQGQDGKGKDFSKQSVPDGKDFHLSLNEALCHLETDSREEIIKSEDIGIKIDDDIADNDTGLIASVSFDEVFKTKIKTLSAECLSDAGHYTYAGCIQNEGRIQEKSAKPQDDKCQKEENKISLFDLCSTTHQSKVKSSVEYERKVELHQFTRKFVKLVDSEIRKIKQFLLQGNLDFTRVNQKIDEWCNEIKDEVLLQIEYKEKIDSAMNGSLKESNKSLWDTCTPYVSVHSIDSSVVSSCSSLEIIIQSASTVSLKSVICDVTKTLSQGISITGANLEELAYNLALQIEKFACDFMSTHSGRKGRQTYDNLKRKKSTEKLHTTDQTDECQHLKHQTSVTLKEKDGHTIVPEDFAGMQHREELLELVHLFLNKVVRLAFQNIQQDLQETEFDGLVNTITTDIVESTQQKINLEKEKHLTVWRLCSQAIRSAKAELWLEYQNPLYVYSQFLVRQCATNRIKQLQKRSSLSSLSRNKVRKILKILNARWHKQGFHASLQADHNLSEILLTKYMTDLTTEPSMNKKSNLTRMDLNESVLNRLEKTLAASIVQLANDFMWPNSSGVRDTILRMKDGEDMIIESLCIQADIAVEKLVSDIPHLVNKVIYDEALAVAVINLVSDVINTAIYDLQLEIQLNKYEGYDIQEMDEEESLGLKEDLKPLRAYLKYVTISEEARSKKMIKKTYNDKKLKKHKHFTAMNLQNVVDSYNIRDEDQVDNSMTIDFLFELEWDMTYENRKPLPRLLKGPIVFLIFCATVFDMVYITTTGAQLDVTSLQEWMVCFAVSVGSFGLVLEFFASIIVGYVDDTHKKN